MSKEELEQVIDTEIQDTGPEVVETPAKPVEPRLAMEPKSEKSIGNLLRKSIKEINRDPDDVIPLTAKERREAAKIKDPVEVPKETSEVKESAPKAATHTPAENKSTETVPPVAPQATGVAPPAALTKEEKAQWDAIPKEMQEAFLRRERDTQKGVEQLKAKYQPIEDVLAPVRPLLQQNGLTEAHAVKQLFDWHRALAVSDKAQALNALQALARSHNIPWPSQTVNQPQPAQTENQQPDPLQAIEQLLEQRLQPIAQQQAAYAAEIQRQKQDAANRELDSFSKDKPHFEKVRVKMAELLTTAANFGRPITLQEAYDEAVWGMADVRSELLQEQETKREAEFKAAQEESVRKAQEAETERLRLLAEADTKRKEQEALEKARRANISPRGSSPVGVVANQGPKKGQSVSDTIRNAIKEVRATV